MASSLNLISPDSALTCFHLCPFYCSLPFHPTFSLSSFLLCFLVTLSYDLLLKIPHKLQSCHKIIVPLHKISCIY
jgi:hypothetical protein